MSIMFRNAGSPRWNHQSKIAGDLSWPCEPMLWSWNLFLLRMVVNVAPWKLIWYDPASVMKYDASLMFLTCWSNVSTESSVMSRLYGIWNSDGCTVYCNRNLVAEPCSRFQTFILLTCLGSVQESFAAVIDVMCESSQISWHLILSMWVIYVYHQHIGENHSWCSLHKWKKQTNATNPTCERMFNSDRSSSTPKSWTTYFDWFHDTQAELKSIVTTDASIRHWPIIDWPIIGVKQSTDYQPITNCCTKSYKNLTFLPFETKTIFDRESCIKKHMACIFYYAIKSWIFFTEWIMCAAL